MIDYVIEGGVDYIVALGTTAETPTLYMPERAVIAMFITNHIAGRVPLVMGVRRKLHVGGAGPAARIRPARRRCHTQRDALLQQAVAGGAVPAFPHRVGTFAPAGDPLQHPRAHGRQHDLRNHAAHRPRLRERHRRQGGFGRHRTDAAHPRQPSRGLPRAVGRRRHHHSPDAPRRRRGDLGGGQRFPPNAS